jgi:hypothetical protein
MHEHLWAGVDLKVGHAAFFLQEMSRSLQPPEQTATNVALQSSGAIVGNLWQLSFYPYFDAFLAMTRSIPEIIQCCFGEDRSPAMANWFRALHAAEQTRRQTFSSQFKPDYSQFGQHPLSNTRNISFHRAGYASVEVRITGLFGAEYIGSPVQSVPIAEGPHNNPDPPFQRNALPVRPMWSDFTIDGKPLFPECQAYLQLAGDLRAKARDICQQVHGSNSLTHPA